MSGIVGNNTGRGSGVVQVAAVAADAITGAEIADDAVDSEHYVDGSIDNAHINDLGASKLTGTIADARFPATLPAASGVNLTALNATNLGSGTVPTARLGSGTASSSTFLRGDQTYAAAGGGKVLQVVSTVKTDAFTSTATSYTAITGMSLAITPSATSSKVLILIRAHFSSAVDGASAHIRFYRDSTNIGNGDAGGSSEQCMAQVQTSSASDGIRRAYPSDVVWLDSPSSTSAVTYSLKLKSDGNTSVFNRTGAQGSIYGNFSSSIVLMEIDA